MDKRKVTRIDPIKDYGKYPNMKLPQAPKAVLNVGVYCRVSSARQEQMRSLSNQISYFVKYVQSHHGYRLYDVYIDIVTGSTTDRTAYQRMLDDARLGNIDLVLVKSVSRLGRDTIEMLTIIRELKALNVTIYFDIEKIDTMKAESELMITLLSGIAEADNQSRSQNTQLGIRHSAEQGTSKLKRRRCYGYSYSDDGDLQINIEQARTVQLIYSLYLSGYSIQMIQRELANKSIPTPTGKDKWSLRTIDEILNNDKYTGNVRLLKTLNRNGIGSGRIKNRGQGPQFIIWQCHPAIITEEDFSRVQNEKKERSNRVINDFGELEFRRGYKYSGKSSKDKENENA